MTNTKKKEAEEPMPCYTTADSKLAGSAEKLDNNDSCRSKEFKTENRTENGQHNDKGEEEEKKGEEEENLVDLDSVLSGGCSTCGSEDHDDVDCEVAAEPKYMMSTALPRPSSPPLSPPAKRSKRATKTAWNEASKKPSQ